MELKWSFPRSIRLNGRVIHTVLPNGAKMDNMGLPEPIVPNGPPESELMEIPW